jgi:thiosulfate/3-mercaptopyruvate sulfurtransferase
MAFADNGALVSADWLEAHLADPDIKILDCTWHHPSTNLDGRTQFRGRHLPRAVHFDIDSISDLANPLPHMLPSPEDFSKKVGLLGIADGDRVVVYDRQFGASAAGRVWWMFHVFGYENVALLDGGFNKWAKEKRPSDMEPTRPEKKVFTAKPPNLALVRTLAQMKDNLNSRKEQVIDARGPAKFDGTQEDVFTFKRLGHMPNAINVPYADLIDPDLFTFIPTDQMGARFASAGIDLRKPIVTTCASGITSCVAALGLWQLGRKDVPVYDGGWAEWNLADDTPTEIAA